MGLSRKGQQGGNVIGVVVWVLLILIILSIILVGNLLPSLGINIENAPEAVSSTVNVVSAMLKPAVNFLFLIVAPSGQDDNVQMIAFAIFLLILLVGTKTLQPFIRGPFMAFFVSAIVGIIASRSLTATILEKSALAASPIAAVSLIIGFIPVYAITKNLDKWGWVNQVWSKMVVFTVVAAVYLIFFWAVFNSLPLGITYAAGIVLLGATELIAPWWGDRRRRARDLDVGRAMGALHVDEETARAIAEGRAEAIDPTTGRPRRH